jgi:hypothetical protein
MRELAQKRAWAKENGEDEEADDKAQKESNLS